jgi:hypothetical protein
VGSHKAASKDDTSGRQGGLLRGVASVGVGVGVGGVVGVGVE